MSEGRLGSDKMASKGKRQPPKFSSFRPQPPTAVTGESSVSSKTNKKLVSESDAKRGADHESASSNANRNGLGKAPTRHSSSSLLSASQSYPNQAFILDTKGDPDNQRYGSLHKYSVPQYRRSGLGSVIGVPRWRKIDRDSERSNFVELTSTQQNHSLSGLSLARSRNIVQELKIKPDAYASVPISIDDDFITLSEPRVSKRKRSSQDHDASDPQSSGEASDDFTGLLVEHTNKPVLSSHSAPKDQDLEISATEPTMLSQQMSDSLIADLNKQLRLNPSKVELWLELINATNKSSSSTSARGNAEVHMSILDEGLRKVKDFAGRETLLMAYMNEAEIAMDSEHLLRTWEDLIKKNDRSVSLRLRFLAFMQSNFSTFRLNDFRDHALEALSACNLLALDSSKEGPEYAKQRFVLLLHTTVCLREAGFRELANAIWQVNLESSLREEISTDRDQNQHGSEDSLRELEEFWEGESQRIGEPVSPDSLASESCEANTNAAPHHSFADISAWCKIEKQASIAAELSARSTDEEDQYDPFRVILFSDIKPFVLRTTGEAEEQHLINAFLAYFQLPAFMPEKYPCGDWMTATLPADNGESSFRDLSDATNRPDMLHLLTNTFQLDDTTLFSTANAWCSPFGHTTRNINRYSMCRLALRRLMEAGVGSEPLAEYLLGWESFAEPSSARKFAKKALKKYPSSLRLYNAYALIEAKSGKDGAFESVLRTVLDSNQNHQDSILLKRTWIWLLIGTGSKPRALSKLLEFGYANVSGHTTEQASNITLLKVRKAISSETDRLISIGNHEQATLQIELGVLLEYLSSPTPLVSALDTFKELSSRFPPLVRRTRPDELLHQFRARLLYTHHTSSQDFPPIKPREVLLESIREFPRNPIFLSLLDLLDPWVGVNDRLNTILTGIRTPSVTSTSDPQPADQYIAPHLYAVLSEIRRYEGGKSTVHAVRHAFERAINFQSGAHCPLLWKWYCLFEVHTEDLNKTRQVFYRAIRACSWVKDIYLMAFDELRAAMSVDDLKGVYELMEDKELRIRVPLDEGLLERELKPPKIT